MIHGNDRLVQNEDGNYTRYFYASLIGPLLGVYYPVNAKDEHTARLMLNSSKLAKLWCGIYDPEMTQGLICDHGGIMLDDAYAQRLDYNCHFVEENGGTL